MWHDLPPRGLPASSSGVRHPDPAGGEMPPVCPAPVPLVSRPAPPAVEAAARVVAAPLSQPCVLEDRPGLPALAGGGTLRPARQRRPLAQACHWATSSDLYVRAHCRLGRFRGWRPAVRCEAPARGAWGRPLLERSTAIPATAAACACADEAPEAAQPCSLLVLAGPGGAALVGCPRGGPFALLLAARGGALYWQATAGGVSALGSAVPPRNRS